MPPESLEHVNQRRWWLYKVWAPSKMFEDYNFRWGANRHSFDPNQKEGYRGEETVLVRHLCIRTTCTLLWRSQNIEMKEDGVFRKFGPQPNYNFSWGSNWLTWSRKNSMDAVCALHHISTSGLLALGYIVMYIIIEIYIYIHIPMCVYIYISIECVCVYMTMHVYIYTQLGRYIQLCIV